MMSEPVSVNPHGSPVIHPVEDHVNPSELPHRRWQYKVLVIHTLSSGEIPRRATHLWVKRQLYAPVMRNANGTEYPVPDSRFGGSLGNFTRRHLSLFGFGVVRHFCFLRFLSRVPKPNVLHVQ